jgi:hypothetical protein
MITEDEEQLEQLASSIVAAQTPARTSKESDVEMCIQKAVCKLHG